MKLVLKLSYRLKYTRTELKKTVERPTEAYFVSVQNSTIIAIRFNKLIVDRGRPDRFR